MIYSNIKRNTYLNNYVPVVKVGYHLSAYSPAVMANKKNMLFQQLTGLIF